MPATACSCVGVLTEDGWAVTVVDPQCWRHGEDTCRAQAKR